jgi:hypothetical protein
VYIYIGCFPKTSVFGKAALDLYKKADPRPLFREPSSKPTGFWERLIDQQEIHLNETVGGIP